MIDTVRFNQKRRLKTQHPAGRLIVDPASGLRCGADEAGNLTWVEVSLPKLLFGTNGKLLKSQADLDRALEKLEQKLSEISNPTARPMEFTRVDLVWQFWKKPIHFFLAHWNVNHPEIRSDVCLYRDRQRITGIEWRGSRVKIKMYDKTDYGIPRHAAILRVEVQLRGAKLREKFWQQTITTLNFSICYRAFRETILKFDPKTFPVLKAKDEVLAQASLEGVRVFEYLEPLLSDKAMRDFRRKAHAHLLRSTGINWHLLLPATQTPPAREVGKIPRVGMRKKGA